MSRCWCLPTVACFLMGVLADLCRSHTKPPRTKLCWVRVVKIWILMIKVTITTIRNSLWYYYYYIPRKVVKFAWNSHLCLFGRFLGKNNIGVDRKMVEKMQFLICTSHTIYVNPIRIRIQIFTTLTQHNLVLGGLVCDLHRSAKTPIKKHATVGKHQHLDI